ncbi:MAG: HIT family protein [Actinomycetota bacterium]
MRCTFCSIVAGDSPAQYVHETDGAVAFMDLLPMTPGHCLIVPKRHVVDLLDIDDETISAVATAAREMARIVKETLRPAGLNLLHNTGAAADQSQFHFHAHLIPRYGGDRLLHPWERRFGDPVEIRAVAEQLRSGHTDEKQAHLEQRTLDSGR